MAIVEEQTKLTGSARRKIAIIAPDLIGGGMTRAYALAEAIAHAGREVEIFGINVTNRPTYPVPPSNLKVTEINGPSRLYCLLKLAMSLDGDILYAVKPRLTSYGIALLKRAVSRTPVVLDFDDWDVAELQQRMTERSGSGSEGAPHPRRIAGRLRARARTYLWRFRRWPNPTEARYVRWMHRLISKADALTVSTRFLQDQYGGTYVPHCKDALRYRPDGYSARKSRQRYGLSGYTILMFPGTARAHKGLEDLLIALDVLQDPSLRLVIVGGRHHGENHVKRLVARWGRWIIRLPAVSQEQMPEVIAAAHAIVVPQRDTVIARAQFPIKLTDGMAMGKPIITTNVGDIPEIVGNSGYLVEPSNPEQLAKAVKEILAQPRTAARRGREGRERVLRCYSLDTVGRVLSEVLTTLDSKPDADVKDAVRTPQSGS